MKIHQGDQEAPNHFMEHLEVQCTLHQLLVVPQVALRKDPILTAYKDNLVTVEPLEVLKNL